MVPIVKVIPRAPQSIALTLNFCNKKEINAQITEFERHLFRFPNAKIITFKIVENLCVDRHPARGEIAKNQCFDLDMNDYQKNKVTTVARILNEVIIKRRSADKHYSTFIAKLSVVRVDGTKV